MGQTCVCDLNPLSLFLKTGENWDEKFQSLSTADKLHSIFMGRELPGTLFYISGNNVLGEVCLIVTIGKGTQGDLKSLTGS